MPKISPDTYQHGIIQGLLIIIFEKIWKQLVVIWIKNYLDNSSMDKSSVYDNLKTLCKVFVVQNPLCVSKTRTWLIFFFFSKISIIFIISNLLWLHLTQISQLNEKYLVLSPCTMPINIWKQEIVQYILNVFDFHSLYSIYKRKNTLFCLFLAVLKNFIYINTHEISFSLIL